MKTTQLFCCLLAICLLIPACTGRRSSVESVSAQEGKPAEKTEPTEKKDEIVLSPSQQAAATIETREAVTSESPDSLRVKGRITLADDHTWRVGVRTVGLVVSVYAGLGDYVHKGQVLARYHADEVRDSRAQYRAALSELERSKAAATQAQRNRDRAQRLLELKAGSQQQLEMSEQDLMSAQAGLRKAQIEVERGRDLLEDDLRVPADPPADRRDETEDQVPIIAPGNGYIIEKNITPGKAVDLTTVTFVIGDLSRVWMLASVRQEDLGKLRKGQSATVTLPGQQDRFYGRVTNLGQEFDPTTRVMHVRIELANADSRLRPEMLANAEIPVGDGKPSLLMPSDAVQQVNGQDVVFIQTAPDRFAVRPVRVGDTVDGRIPILEGVKAGDRVAIRGSFILKSQLLKSTLESE